MIKRKIIILSSALFSLFLVTYSARADSIKKVFLDRDLQIIEYEEFASYYRVELHSDKPDKPILYRLYTMSNRLITEGEATKLDETNYSDNIFVGENIFYTEDGNIAERYVFNSPGKMVNADYYEAFDKNKLIVKGSLRDNKLTGERYDSNDNGCVYHYFVADDILQGEFKGYVNDTLFVATNFIDGIENGVRNYYFSSGQIMSSVNYVNGLCEGTYESYDINGRVKDRVIYKNGLPTGTAVYNLNGPERPQYVTYYTMETASGAPLSIMVTAEKNEYYVDDIEARTRVGKKIGGHRDHLNILRFVLSIQNTTDEPIEASLQNVRVWTYKQDINQGRDIYIDQNVAREICMRSFAHSKEMAYEEASRIAKEAATTSTYTYGNQFYFPTFSILPVGHSVGNSYTRSFNGGVYYQVSAIERERARQEVSRNHGETIDEMERCFTSSFVVPAKESLEKEILAAEDLSKMIHLSFSIEGYEYSLIIEEEDL